MDGGSLPMKMMSSAPDPPEGVGFADSRTLSFAKTRSAPAAWRPGLRRCPLDATSGGQRMQSAAQGESEFEQFSLSEMLDSAISRKQPQRAATVSFSAC